jgi:prepilin-type N-terminal cleavage/methylation domain-containing protein
VVRTLRRDQDGFTMIEMLVVMSIAVVVLAGVYTAFDSFGTESSKSSRRADAEDTLRRAMGTFVSTLREAPAINPLAAAGSVSPIAIARTNDIVFRNPRVANGWLRYCAGPSGTGSTALWVGRLTSPAVVDPGVACTGASAGGWSYGRAVAENLTQTAGLLRFDTCLTPATVACTAASIRSITMNLVVQYTPGRVIRLSSSVSPRNRA